MRAPLILVLVAAAGLSACVPNRAYRTGVGSPSVLREALTPRQFDPTQNDVGTWPYDLAFIEFDDRGEMFDRTQLDRAVETIVKAKADARARTEANTRQARAAGEGEPAPVDAVVVTFVHGWKNNASDSSGNVWGFRQLLAGLSLQYGDAPIVGVYVGWRGAVVSVPIVKEFTFFDRHQKSQNLPNAHMVEALLKVMQAAKGRSYDESTISVLIGHSFGGAVLESALTQPLMAMIVNAGAAGVLRWPATMILLLNEAQEATRSYQLIESLHANTAPREPCVPPGGTMKSQFPAIFSISSRGDYATRAFFPAVQSVARPFNSLRTYPAPDFLGLRSQTPMFFNTTAHLRAFQSHVIGRRDDPEVQDALKVCKENVVTTGDPEFVIVEKPGALNRTPYWVAHMSSNIVPDHSTIFTPTFRTFLIVLIYQATIP